MHAHTQTHVDATGAAMKQSTAHTDVSISLNLIKVLINWLFAELLTTLSCLVSVKIGIFEW